MRTLRVWSVALRYLEKVPQEPACRSRSFGQYQLTRLIAIGATAEIFEAQRQGARGFARRVAVKRMLPALRSDARLKQMFCDEARIQASLSHPNIVEVLDFGQVDDRLFMALEYVDGFSCSYLIDSLLNRRRTVDLNVVLFILREVLRGLSYLHSACDAWGRPLGLVHRDIAPNNVLISKAGQIKIADFGVYYSRLAQRRTAPGELKGKLGYASPEQVRGEPVDERSDLFSLAVMAAEMLIGRPLLQGETAAYEAFDRGNGARIMLDSYGAHIPEDVKSVLARALELDPHKRPPNATSFAVDLQWAVQRHGLEMESYGLAEAMADLGLIAIESSVRVIPAGTRR